MEHSLGVRDRGLSPARVPERNTCLDRLSAVVSFGDEALGDAPVPVGVPQAMPLRMPIAQA